MKIPQEYLEPKNYQGTRLIEVTDKKALDLMEKIASFQPEAEPWLKKMEEIDKKTRPFYEEIAKLQERIKSLQEKYAPDKAEWDKVIKELDAINAKAQNYKNKLTPLVNKLVEGQLGEFEKATQLVNRDGKVYIEVIDEVEEKVKQVREAKAKTK